MTSNLDNGDDDVGVDGLEPGARVIEDVHGVEHDGIHPAELLARHEAQGDEERGQVTLTRYKHLLSSSFTHTSLLLISYSPCLKTSKTLVEVPELSSIPLTISSYSNSTWNNSLTFYWNIELRMF